MTSDPQPTEKPPPENQPGRPVVFGIPRGALMILAMILLGALAGGAAVYLAFGARDAAIEQTKDANEKAAVAARQAKNVIDCVTNPQATPKRCRQEAKRAKAVIDGIDATTSNGLSPADQADVAAIAADVLAASPQLSLEQVADTVLARIKRPQDGRAGTPGESGPAGITPTASQVRALIAQFYAANPPSDGAPGQPGTDGTDSTAPGPQGPVGGQGDQGPAGGDGQPGADGKDGSTGADGRGIASVTCDQDTEQFVVTYTDGATQPVEGSDCVAGGPPL